MDAKPGRFRFSLRTLLILTAMLAILLAQRPYTKVEKRFPFVPSQTPSNGLSKGNWDEVINPKRRVLSPRFKYIAIAEGVILVVWAGILLFRRPTHPSSF